MIFPPSSAELSTTDIDDSNAGLDKNNTDNPEESELVVVPDPTVASADDGWVAVEKPQTKKIHDETYIIAGKEAAVDGTSGGFDSDYEKRVKSE